MKNCTVTVVGVDGSEWKVHDRSNAGAPVFLGQDPEGLLEAPVQTVWQKVAHGAGASFAGVKWEPADLVLQFVVRGTAQRSWASVESAWRRAWSYEEQSTLIVNTAESGARRLKVQMLEAPKVEVEVDPHRRKVSVMVMTLRAADPFWHGLPDVQVVKAATASGSGSVTVWNPTDRPMWLRWVLQAGARWTLPDFDYGGGLRTITMPTAYTSRDVAVDTHPLREQITVPGLANAWEYMNGVQFMHPVPAWTEPVEVPVSWTGASGSPSAAVYMDRNWTRPWGME